MRRLVPLLLFSVLGGCAGVPKVEQRAPLKPGPKPSAVLLKRVVAKPQRGARIGNIYVGAGIWNSHITWQGGRVAMDPEEFGEELRRQFEANGLEVEGDPRALFEDTSEWKADYLIGALITDIKLDLWYPLAGYNNFNVGRGNGFVDVEWQIYSRRSRSVQVKVSTKGSAHEVSITDVGPNEPLIQAFSIAARNLLAEQKFMDLIAPSEETLTTSAPTSLEIALVPPQPTEASTQSKIDRARICVLTIFAGDGLGSGFLVSKDGYVLTNQHVVGEAKTVTAKTLTGREIIGEVIRTDRVRDVALVKLEQDLYEALPLGKSDTTPVGSDVYAIGSPHTEDLGQTVTKGIVSGFRVIDDLRYVQSDVAINPGNSGGPLIATDGSVIGIAVSKRLDAEGMGFFVPIESALKTLGIIPKDGESP